ncbi:MAG TPA: ornithine cyclodeaminase family protein [Burkholderiales bacterium]|nr:ornithine cyclodeaminase family protein [Burkholderiales bacterium]
MSVLYLSQADTQALLAWPDVIACLARAYGRGDDPRATPPKVVARRDGQWLRALPAIAGGGEGLGVKIIAKGKPKAADHLIALWDPETGNLACLMSAKHVTAMRTAGTSALAVDRIAPAGGLRVAVLGSGREASTHVAAIATVRKIESLAVYSPTAANREAFAKKKESELKIACRAEKSARAAVEGADLVIAAARSHDETPILEGAWLKNGTMVVSIGSTVAEQREVDPAVIERATVIVADVPGEVAHETGDMIAAKAAGVVFESKMVALADVVRGSRAVKQARDNIVLFKSVGSGLQDIAVSGLCHEKARAAKVGSELPMWGEK